MKTLACLVLILYLSIGVSLDRALAQVSDFDSVRLGDRALAFASGSIQKTSPIDGTVNLVTGDNQSTGNRMLLGKGDSLYLRLNTSTDVAVGDLFTVYRRVRKVFHPVTREYLGFVVNRSAVVKVTAADHALTTAQAVISYGPISPGDPVVRFVAPTLDFEPSPVENVSNLDGMIIELQADRSMTLVAQSNVVYLDRGREEGLKAGDLLDIQRYSAGLPSRTIGKLKVLTTEPHTGVAKVLKANTRVMKGDRFKLVESAAPMLQPIAINEESLVAVAGEQASHVVPGDLVASKLKVQDASGQSRLNLGELAKFLHYDSGDAAIKPESYTVLDQLIEYLHTSGDTRLIRIEGHTDNVEIGPSLKSRYPDNLELSKVRANGVLRYLLEKGGVESSRTSAVGLGDSKPVATNAVEEGRTKNRRVEILLYSPDGDTSAPQPNAETQAQSRGGNLSTLNARDDGDQQTPASAALSDRDDSPRSGTLSVGDSSQTSGSDGTSGENGSDPSGATSTDTNKQDLPHQPAAGTPAD
ncbi:MAG: OmpA family protein [Nitrospira sp.]|nr:OmpA family protein [Nitrospira sp.]MDH4370746.1 OmpA family protein [Nitrospira sp.]MDH5346421.1 OmpA family protein [Nitrospira sp.]MDH5496937.1 OmpA family protein [Nitrospira sp.]MDH5724157.1 OmpA family protein [Nitrospira sp.]